MQKLRQFTYFDCESFLNGKTLVYLSGKKPDPKHGFVGLAIEVMIMDDNTDYGDGLKGLNEFEKFTVKVQGADETYLSNFKRKQKIKIVDIQKASTWGDYQENLTIFGRVVPLHEEKH